MEKIIEDNKDVRWKKDGVLTRGYGYVGDNGTIGLIRCPECGRENYMANIPSGQCTWCPFNAKE